MFRKVALLVVAVLALAACGRQRYEHYITGIESEGFSRVAFEFAAEGFSRSYIWVDVYEYGVFVDRVCGGEVAALQYDDLSGSIEVYMGSDSGVWQFSYRLGNRSFTTAVDVEALPRVGFSSMAWWNMQRTVPVRDGEVIDLLSMKLGIPAITTPDGFRVIGAVVGGTEATASVPPAAFQYVVRVKFVK